MFATHFLHLARSLLLPFPYPALSGWTDCRWSPISTQFTWIAWWAELGACVFNTRVSPVWVWNFFKKSNLKLVYLRWSCFVNNVLINSVKFSKCLDFETLLWKSCNLNSESKSQVICGCEKFSLGRTASFSVKILFNRQIFRTTQFCSLRGCCVRLTSACCACFWNKNSFRLSCSWKVQT